MKNYYLPTLFLFLVIALGSISWTDPETDELDFPYKFYDYNPIFNPADNNTWGYKDIDIDNPKANLGRVLFYDKLLSADESTSCESCHKQEFSFGDNTAFSEGINNTLTTRNSQNLNDIGWQQNEGFFWGFKSQFLEEAVLQPIINPNELGLEFDDLIEKLELTDYYPSLFKYAFNDEDISEDKIAIALTEFIRSMNTLYSKLDRRTASPSSIIFTDSEILGWQLFNSNCSTCHQSPHFGLGDFRSPFNSNSFLINNGLDEVYTDVGWTPDNNDSLNSTFAYFKTPTLRNLKFTAPYMHDGRFETLEEVIDFYSTGLQPNENSFASVLYYGAEIDSSTMQRGFFYTEEEKQGLIDFLNTLNDEYLITSPIWSNPFLEEPNEKVTPQTEIQYRIYAAPNPVETSTTINISDSPTEVYNLLLINMEGKIVQEVKSVGGTHNLERNNLPAGIYYLRINRDDFNFSMKLLFL